MDRFRREAAPRGCGRAAWMLARQAHLARRQRSVWGWLGADLAPLAPLVVYLPLVASDALPSPPGQVSPLAYAALGYLTWSLLCDGVMAPTRGLTAFRSALHAPVTAVLAGLVEAAYRTLVRAVVLIPLAILTHGGVDGVGCLLAILLLPGALALAGGLGVILCFWAVPWPDVATGAATALRLTLLPSFVLFPLPDGLWSRVLLVCNPWAVWTEALRALTLGEALPLPLTGALMVWTAVGLGGLGVCLPAFLKLAPRLREMGA